jgi:hypothetical protein
MKIYLFILNINKNITFILNCRFTITSIFCYLYVDYNLPDIIKFIYIFILMSETNRQMFNKIISSEMSISNRMNLDG